MSINSKFWERLARVNTHPIQLQILETLSEPGVVTSPNALSKQLGEPLGNVSYHVKVLLKAGLIQLDHTEPRRGALEHFYRWAS